MSKLLNYINGEWVSSKSDKFVKNINPATGESLGEIIQSTSEDVENAVKAAKVAQKKWALVPAPQRGEFLFRVGQLMKERKEELSQVLTAEMGKVIEEARGEVQEGIDMEIGRAHV